MNLRAIPLALLCVLAAGAAHAAGFNLYWNDCSAGASATTNRDFACNTNAGTNELCISYDPPPEITAVTGIEAYLDLQSADPTLPNWWQLRSSGGCRPTATSLRTTGPSSCFDPWQGQGVGGTVYQLPADNPAIPPNGARLLGVAAVPDGTQMPALVPGTEYFAFVIRISNARTVGPTACAGCSIPMCIALNRVGLYPPGAPKPTFLFNPITNNFVGWQGGMSGDHQCFGATPAQNHTWGQIKTVYR